MNNMLEEEKAALIRYAKIFMDIEIAQSDETRQAELPKLRVELHNLRIAQGWQSDMLSHLNLMVKAAEVIRADAQAKIKRVNE